MNSHLILARATSKDLDSLKQLLLSNGQRADLVIDERSVYLFAEIHGRKAGMIGAEHCGKQTLIRSAAVLSGFRSHGLGRILFGQLVQLLREQNIEYMFLFCKDAAGFWEKQGFNVCSIHELVSRLPEARQVRAYIGDGSISTDIAWSRKLDDVASHYELSDTQFEKSFATATLDSKLFTHEAHLRLAWIHIRRHGVVAAIANIRAQLKWYVASLGASHKYHDTVTVAAIKAVAHFCAMSEATDFYSFIREHNRLSTHFRQLLQSHYSINVFASDEARQRFVEPDLQAF